MIKEKFLSSAGDTVTGPSCAGSQDLIRFIPYILQIPLYFVIVGLEAGVVSWDSVICLHLNYIPEYMACWVKDTGDNNGWPTSETLKLMHDRGLDIVAKDVGKLHNTWRVSTSAWETILFNSLSVIQKKSYLSVSN